jgi:Uma2 family endonuclease
MSTALSLPLMTVEEFFELPEPVGDFTYELHFGELVEVGPAKKKHIDLQTLICDILKRALGLKRWRIEIELPYGLTPGYDARAADMGVVLRKRWDAIPDDDYLIGSPDLVVQVKSRSNRDRKMEEDAVVHITHGASAVLLIKPLRREIIMVTASSRRVYGPGERIELPAPLSRVIAIDDIFPSS